MRTTLMTRLLFLGVLLLLLGCASAKVTTTSAKIAPLTSPPSFQASKPFFFWGFVGHQTIDLDMICGEKGILQFQTQDTFGDHLFSILTGGVYRPRSVLVWCES